MRAHVDACAHCSDLVLVTQTFQQARAQSEQAAACWLAEPAVVARATAPAQCSGRAVSRPITIAQTLRSGSCTVFVGVVFRRVAIQSRSALGVVVVRVRAFAGFPSFAGWIRQADWNLLLLIPGFGVLALLSGLVVYLASEKSVRTFVDQSSEEMRALPLSHPQLSVSQ